MKQLTAIGLAMTLLVGNVNVDTVQASCYSYNGSRQEQIKLQDKQTGYLRVWATKSLKGRMVGKLRHGEVIRTLKFVEDPVCGGAVYIKFRNNKGQTAYGWVFSDVLVASIED
ncbi:hypothetical protein [Chamaesiphon sp. OTE_8_metabat_110]|uniref:hypothetical protein n=1 Tax=Chamaesiphon sp. OTE_8_metabat_110 TaxID=2964696 RepID=UPI00286C7016|nr:hypothetical protein [Chamaesiphon sp. OTE_8_metabat_110]